MTTGEPRTDGLETRLAGALEEIAARAPEPVLLAGRKRTHLHRRRFGPLLGAAVLAGAALLVPIALVAALSNSDTPANEDEAPVDDRTSVTTPGTARSPAAAAKAEVDRVADRLLSFDRESGYGRTSVDYEAQRVTLLWKGPVPDSVQDAINLSPPHVTVIVQQAPFAAAELIRAGSRLVEASQSGRFDTTVVSAAPTRDFSGLVVEVLDPEKVSKDALASVAGVPVTVRRGAPIQE
jgi:hypothetical protein